MIILTPQIYACNRHNTNSTKYNANGGCVVVVLECIFLVYFPHIFRLMVYNVKWEVAYILVGRVAFMNPWQIHYKEDLSWNFDENSIQKLFPSSYAIEVAAALFGSFQWTFFLNFSIFFFLKSFFRRCSFLKC